MIPVSHINRVRNTVADGLAHMTRVNEIDKDVNALDLFSVSFRTLPRSKFYVADLTCLNLKLSCGPFVLTGSWRAAALWSI
ncbi:hypothetical protein V6N12_030399 [Hibiscus sabdariffa]|uniref:RNase H type-1 domain-containing protein n=1 Tax=Hibiscus sabdariffa TaxID=183260 RepID=A0ABR2C124_9ROSI